MAEEEEEEYSSDEDNCESTSEVHLNSISDFKAQLENLMLKVIEADSHLKEERKLVQTLEGKLKKYYDSILKLESEKTAAIDKVSYLQKCFDKSKEDNEQLKSKISELTVKLRSIEVENAENEQKYNMIYKERVELYSKIKDLEDDFLKQGQTDQTIHMNKPKEFKFYNPKEGLGYESPKILKNVSKFLPTLYDHRYMGYGYQQFFLRSSDEALANEDVNRKRNDKMQLPLDYEKLNDSYKTREITLSDDYFHSYSDQELAAKTSSSSNNRLYIPPLILEHRITELETDLQTKCKSFDDERDQFLKQIKDLEQTVSDITIQKTFQKVPSSIAINSPNVSIISEKEFDDLMNSDDCSTDKYDLFKINERSKASTSNSTFNKHSQHSHFTDKRFSSVSDKSLKSVNRVRNTKKEFSKTKAATQSFTLNSCVLKKNKVSFNENQKNLSDSNFVRNDCVCKIKTFPHKHHAYKNKQKGPTFNFRWVPKKVTNLQWVPKTTNQTGPKFKWVPKVT